MSLLLALDASKYIQKKGELDFKQGNKSAVLRPDVVVVCLVLTTTRVAFLSSHLIRHLCKIFHNMNETFSLKKHLFFGR